jgi:hypothetical protein
MLLFIASPKNRLSWKKNSMLRNTQLITKLSCKVMTLRILQMLLRTTLQQRKDVHLINFHLNSLKTKKNDNEKVLGFKPL